jgi:hypothetical protein
MLVLPVAGAPVSQLLSCGGCSSSSPLLFPNSGKLLSAALTGCRSGRMSDGSMREWGEETK